jgi:hypothetical protein
MCIFAISQIEKPMFVGKINECCSKSRAEEVL